MAQITTRFIATKAVSAIKLGSGAATSSQLPFADGSGGASYRSIVAGDVPTLNQNTTGSAGSFTGNLVGDVTGIQGATVLSATSNATLATLSGLTSATNLATVGTITSGGWNGTAIPVAYGGTGNSSALTARGFSGLNIDQRATFSNAAYTVLSTDRYVAQIGTLSAPRVVTLPAANSVNPGQNLYIADESGTASTTNTLTITAAGADTIDGSASKTIRSAYGFISLYSNGTNGWFVGVEAIGRGGTGLSTLPSDGQLLIGSSATSSYSLGTLTAGSGISITNAGGSITVAATGTVGANQALSNLSAVAINTGLLPGTDNSIALGSSSKRWTTVWAQFLQGDSFASIDSVSRTLSDSAGTAALSWANTSTISVQNRKVINGIDPTSASDLATKNYVDTALAALNPAESVTAASTANIAGIYLNGVLGVGATFTTTATGVFTIDGVTPTLGQRVLFKDQSSGFQNGIYNITTLGSIGVSAVFTRASDYNTASDMNSAGLIPVINGTVNALSSWQQVATITTVGTDSLVFTEFTANPSLYLLKANNLSDVTNKTASFNNLSPMTTGGDLIYGGTSGTGTRLPNGSAGQVLTSAGTTLPPTWSSPSGTNADNLQLTNLGLAASASSGTLTVSLKQVDGATDPAAGAGAVTFGIRTSTAASGAFNLRSVTAALSQTLTVGNQLGFANYSSSEYLWVYAIDSDGAGTIKLGMSSARYDDGTLVSTVADAPVVTISQASPGVISLTGHGWNNGDLVCFRSVGGTLPSPINTDLAYYVVARTANTFEISNSAGGTAINTTTSGSGVFHAYAADSRIVSAAVYTSMPSRLIGRIISFLSNVSTGYPTPTEIAVATPAVVSAISPNGARFAMQGRNQGSSVPSISSSVTAGVNLALTYAANSDGTVNDFSAKSGVALSLAQASITGTNPISKGGTNVTSVTIAPAATAFAGWDANKNLSANNLLEGYATTATAAGTTTLVVGSAFQQYFTGSTTQTVTMPAVNTLALGQQFQVTNLSTGVVTVQSSGANVIALQAANTTVLYTCISTSGTTAASWNPQFNGSIGAIAPTVQKFTSGTAATYTTPNGVQYIRVRMVGGGGGGAGGVGSGNTNNGSGGNGTATTFGTSLLSAGGGNGANGAAGNAGGAGGSSSLGSGPIGTALSGGAGGSSGSIAAAYATAGSGGVSALGGAGGAGGPAIAGGAGAANTGSGGGGGGTNNLSGTNGGGGGGAGGFVDAIIIGPSVTYTYTIGAAGTAGSAGTNGFAGGAGAAGYIEVTEYYSSGVASSGGGAYTPTVQKFTSGTAQTYTTPSNVSYIQVRMVGGGGGGAGSGTADGTVATAGGVSTFGTSLLTANGGAHGVRASGGGGGGTVTVNSPAIFTVATTGTDGGGYSNAVNSPGGLGAGTPFSGTIQSSAGNPGLAPPANTGGGGSGGGINATGSTGSGGGAGGYIEAFIYSPLSTYTYSVGTAGSGGGAGASGLAGGAGAAGYIEVTEFYNNGAVGSATTVTAGSQPNITALNSATGVLINGLTATTPTTGQVGESITGQASSVATNTSTQTTIVSITLTAGVWLVGATAINENDATQVGSNAYLYLKGVNGATLGTDELFIRGAAAVGGAMTFTPRVLIVASADADKTVAIKIQSVTAAGHGDAYIAATRIA